MNKNFKWIGQTDDGKQVILNRFQGEFRLMPGISSAAESDAWIAAHQDRAVCGVVLDVETTGLNRATDQVIEIGVRQFWFDRETGHLVKIGEGYSAMQDPGRPIPARVTQVTGIRTLDVQGRNIDWKRVDQLISAADLVLAHNASFDRPFIDRNLPSSRKKQWGCTLSQVDWLAKGYTASKLEMLTVYHGYFCDAHRALEDADSTLHLMSHGVPDSGQTYLVELLKNASREKATVVAAGAPFHTKDDLRLRGYRWDATERCWKRQIFRDQLDNEVVWLESSVYQGSFKGRVDEISAIDQFKA